MKEIYKKDEYSPEITYNQAMMLDRYIKIYIDEITNKIIKREKYSKSKLDFIYYHISNSENELEVVVEQMKLCDNIVIIRVNIQGDYTVRNLNTYFKNTSLISKERSITKDNKLICTQDININTNVAILESTEKDYYKNNKLVLEVTYNEDGSIDRLISLSSYNDQDWEYYDSSNFQDLQAKFEEDLSYYFTANFNPPGVV